MKKVLYIVVHWMLTLPQYLLKQEKIHKNQSRNYGASYVNKGENESPLEIKIMFDDAEMN